MRFEARKSNKHRNPKKNTLSNTYLQSTIEKAAKNLNLINLNKTFWPQTETVYLYNNKCFVGDVWGVCGLMRACDSSLEPSCYKNDHVMEEIRFARARSAQKCVFYYIRQF